MVHSTKGDKSKRYPKVLGHRPMVHSIKGDKNKQCPNFGAMVPQYTVSREIRVSSTQSFGA